MSINRHLARSIALQALFELDVNQNLGASREQVEEVLDRDLSEFANIKSNISLNLEEEKKNKNEYIFNLIKTVQERLATIDEIIARAAPEWPLEKINVVDRNILRIGLAELLFGEVFNVPPKVAIDEAIELAKNFGGDTSHRFINGVLGAIYKEMGEPRKEETSKEDNQKKTKNLETQNLAGALVYSKVDGQIFIAFVKDVFKHWTLPKGKLMPEEDLRVGAIRKVKEEIGINVTIKDMLIENSYIANSADGQEGKKIKKVVNYFLAEGSHEPLKLEEGATGLTEAKWFALDEIENLKIYSDVKNIIALGIEKIIR